MVFFYCVEVLLNCLHDVHSTLDGHQSNKELNDHHDRVLASVIVFMGFSLDLIVTDGLVMILYA